jgi:hypothetical protein
MRLKRTKRESAEGLRTPGGEAEIEESRLICCLTQSRPSESPWPSALRAIHHFIFFTEAIVLFIVIVIVVLVLVLIVIGAAVTRVNVNPISKKHFNLTVESSVVCGVIL